MATTTINSWGTQWRSRFFTIWGGQAISLLGSQLVQFALIWHLTVETGSATVLATATFVGMFPQVLLGPFVGTLVDRWDRRRIMILADSVIAAFTILLAVLFALGRASIGFIYVVMFVRSLASSFHSNAMNASTSLMVPAEYLTRIQGINQMLNGGLNVISAPIGALLLGVLPLQSVLMIDVVTALIAIVPLFFIRIPQTNRVIDTQNGQTLPSFWQDFRAGFRYLLGWSALVIVGLMTLGINFTIVPAFSLMPLMVKDFFGGNAIHLSWVESAMGIGVIAGGALLGIWGGFKKKILTSMLGLAGMGIGTLVIALAPQSLIWVAVSGAFLVGLMNPLTMGPFFAILQSVVAPEMQARIFTLLGSVGGAMAPIGLVIAGPVADRFGIQSWFFVSGFLCMLMALVGLSIPALMHIEDKAQSTM